MSKDDIAYIGKGRFMVGIPDTDLTTADVAALAKSRHTTPAQLRKQLIESGLYREGSKQ